MENLKNIICIPFAFEVGMNTGVNVANVKRGGGIIPLS